MVILGTDDLLRCRRFYEAGLGWTPWGVRQSRTSVKYLNGGVLLAMIDRGYLAVVWNPHMPMDANGVLQAPS